VHWPGQIHEILPTLATAFEPLIEQDPFRFNGGDLIWGGSIDVVLDASHRTPDYTILERTANELRDVPTVVFEVALSQTHVDAVRKAVKYLGGSQGKILCAVVINIDLKDRTLNNVDMSIWHARRSYTDEEDAGEVPKLECDLGDELKGPYMYLHHQLVVPCVSHGIFTVRVLLLYSLLTASLNYLTGVPKWITGQGRRKLV